MARKTFLCLCTCFALFLLAGAGQAQTGQTCGGIGNLQCPAGQACQFPAGQCNQPDLAGVCVAVPDPCPKQGPPFCGCNGKTYANECELLKAGVRPAKQGACGHGEGNQDNKPPAKTCTSNADCQKTEFCEFKAGTCAAPGACLVRPEICPEIFKPVCGCDNKTYGNDCQRQAAGVSLKSDGECPMPK